MKVLVISNMYPNVKYPYYGVFVKQFCVQLKKIYIDYEKITMSNTKYILFKLLNYVRFYMEIIIVLLFKRYDVVYIHYASYCALPVLFINKYKKINIYTNLHGSDVVPEKKNHFLMNKFTSKLLSASHRIIVPSEYFLDFVKTKYSLSGNNIYIYPSGGVNKNEFYPFTDKKRRAEMKKLGLNEETHYIGFVGRISYGKGWNTFLKSICLLKNEIGNVKFIIVGNGSDTAKLNKLIEINNLSDLIIRYDLLSQDKLAIIYNILDFFVFLLNEKERVWVLWH